MTPSGLAAVGQRIADIQARFRPAPGFADTLREVAGPEAPAVGEAEGSTGVRDAREMGGATARSAESTARRISAEDPTGWAERLPAEGRAWAPAIQRAAEGAGVEPRLLAALVRAESGFDEDARSHAGARGLAQLMPGTAAALGVDPDDPRQNLAGGARYLREQLDRFGAVDLALAAYNAGPHRVAQAGGIPRIAETQAYVETVRRHYEALR